MTDQEMAENYVACPTTGCWFWLGPTHKKYAVQHRRDAEGKMREVTVHRVVLAMKLGRRLKPGYKACHSCDRPGCIRPEHLWEGTQLDNIADRHAKGRDGRTRRERNWSHLHPEATQGENNPRAKLTWADVREIRKLTQSMNDCALGRQYGMARSTIRNIRIGKLWPE